MGFPVYTTLDSIARLAALNAAAYPTVVGDETKLCLFQNDTEPDIAMTDATFTEADYVGYARITLVMGVPSMNDQGLIVSRTNLCNFLAAAGVDPQTIYGVYLIDQDGLVTAAQRFDTPQQMGGDFPSAIAGLWRTSEPLTNYGWIDVEA